MNPPEDLEFEVQALQATYGEEEVQVNCVDGGTAVVAIAVAPRTDTRAEHERFVAARLVMTAGPGYPAEMPEVKLSDARGLPDARLAQLQAALAAEAASLAGELQLGHLCETAADLLTAANQPEGDCAFCLQPLLPQAAAEPGSGSNDNIYTCGPPSGGGTGCNSAGDGVWPAVVRLGCYHCYHLTCFAAWWQWQQKKLEERERQLWAEYKSMAPLRLLEESIRRETLSGSPVSSGGGNSMGGGKEGRGGRGRQRDAGRSGRDASEGEEEGEEGEGEEEEESAYVLSCPACRADVAPASLAHAWQHLQQASPESWRGGGGGGTSGRAALQQLPETQRQQLQAMQRRHAAVMQRQEACGGLVEATHSVTLAELQQAAAVAAEREAAAVAGKAAKAAAAAAAGAAGAKSQQAAGDGPGVPTNPSHADGRGRGRGRGTQQRSGRGSGGRQHQQGGRGSGGRQHQQGGRGRTQNDREGGNGGGSGRGAGGRDSGKVAATATNTPPLRHPHHNPTDAAPAAARAAGAARQGTQTAAGAASQALNRLHLGGQKQQRHWAPRRGGGRGRAPAAAPGASGAPLSSKAADSGHPPHPFS